MVDGTVHLYFSLAFIAVKGYPRNLGYLEVIIDSDGNLADICHKDRIPILHFQNSIIYSHNPNGPLSNLLTQDGESVAIQLNTDDNTIILDDLSYAVPSLVSSWLAIDYNSEPRKYYLGVMDSGSNNQSILRMVENASIEDLVASGKYLIGPLEVCSSDDTAALWFHNIESIINESGNRNINDAEIRSGRLIVFDLSSDEVLLDTVLLACRPVGVFRDAIIVQVPGVSYDYLQKLSFDLHVTQPTMMRLDKEQRVLAVIQPFGVESFMVITNSQVWLIGDQDSEPKKIVQL